ncbi:MAG: hypothetical protein IJU93_09285, partial [Lachnospiraceae bacterium]|nr:hypothetical protein [Lachnospiraceae bacterium]
DQELNPNCCVKDHYKTCLKDGCAATVTTWTEIGKSGKTIYYTKSVTHTFKCFFGKLNIILYGKPHKVFQRFTFFGTLTLSFGKGLHYVVICMYFNGQWHILNAV